MIPSTTPSEGPVMRAAQKALATGIPEYVLIWVSEEAANTVRNLVERACCERTTRDDTYHYAADWYFRTINRLHTAWCGPRTIDTSIKSLEERGIIYIVERACETGNFGELSSAIQDLSGGEMRQRFSDLMQKREFAVNDIAAGREYVSAFIDFVAWLNLFHSGTRGRVQG